MFIHQDPVALALQFTGQRIGEGAAVEGLADGLENPVGGQFEGFAGGLQATFDQMGAGEAHAAYLALVIEQDFLRLGPGQQAHLIGLGDVLFMVGRPHVIKTATIDQVDVAGAQSGHLHRHVDGGVAGTEDDAAVGQG
ncbi:hypothetical protein D3C76_747540 [compost metagenome]